MSALADDSSKSAAFAASQFVARLSREQPQRTLRHPEQLRTYLGSSCVAVSLLVQVVNLCWDA